MTNNEKDKFHEDLETLISSVRLREILQAIGNAERITDIFAAHYNRAILAAKAVDVPIEAMNINAFKFLTLTAYYTARVTFELSHEEATKLLTELVKGGCDQEEVKANARIAKAKNKYERSHES
jgi:hypothetical protein